MHSRSPVLLFNSIAFSLLSFFITPQIEAALIMHPMDGTTNKDLRGITGSSPTDVYAVGKKGTILHYDGTQCKLLPNSSREDLNGVWGSFEKGIINVFAVGKKGTILHYDGTQCKLLPNSSREDLNGVWGSFEKGIINVFAVGKKGTILHYDGTRWFQMSNPEQSKLNGIWGSSINNIFAVGDRGTVLHFDGKRWLSLQKHTPEDLNAVSGCYDKTGINLYAAGKKGAILHYDGAQWTKMTSPVGNNLNDIYGRQPNNIIAVGKKNTIIHFDGEKWSQVTEPSNANLYAVWVSENPHVFVATQYGVRTGSAGYWIQGKIYASCSNCSSSNRTLIQNAEVEALEGGVWVHKITTPTGEYGYLPNSPVSLSSNALRFSAADYKTEILNVALFDSRIIETYTYLLHNSYSLNCISGAISYVPSAYPGLHQSISSPTTITIKLFQLINCAWTQIGSAINPNGEGHYCFSGLSAGTYKVVPQRTGNTYIPEYDNINIAIPQTVPQAYNFTQQ